MECLGLIPANARGERPKEMEAQKHAQPNEQTSFCHFKSRLITSLPHAGQAALAVGVREDTF